MNRPQKKLKHKRWVWGGFLFVFSVFLTTKVLVRTPYFLSSHSNKMSHDSTMKIAGVGSEVQGMQRKGREWKGRRPASG